MEQEETQLPTPKLEFTAKVALVEVVRRRRFILVLVGLFLILGIIIAKLSTKQYTASATILPQVSADKGLGKKFGNFAALVGLRLGESGGNDILPTLYPIIVNSAPFQREILKTPLTIRGQKKQVTLSYYLKEIKKEGALSKVSKYTIGLPGLIVGSLRSKEAPIASAAVLDSTLYYVDPIESGQMGFLSSNISVRFNDLEGFIEINAIMEEPVAAAQLAYNTQIVLQEFIIEYNIQKAKEELNYVEERFEEAQQVYNGKKASLGNYKDRNQNFIISATSNRIESLEAEYDLAFNMYSQLAGQKETAKLQVKKDTPIFTVLKPVTVPLSPSGPNTILIILEFLFLGLFIGILWVLFKKYLPLAKQYLKIKQ